MNISLAIPTNSDYWTNSTDDETSGWLQRAIAAYEARLVAAVQKRYPDAVIFVRMVPERASATNRNCVECDDPDTKARILDDLAGIEQDIDISDID